MIQIILIYDKSHKRKTRDERRETEDESRETKDFYILERRVIYYQLKQNCSPLTIDH